MDEIRKPTSLPRGTSYHERGMWRNAEVKSTCDPLVLMSLNAHKQQEGKFYKSTSESESQLRFGSNLSLDTPVTLKCTSQCAIYFSDENLTALMLGASLHVTGTHRMKNASI